VTHSAASAWKFCTFDRNERGRPAVADRSQLGARILLAIAARLEGAARCSPASDPRYPSPRSVQPVSSSAAPSQSQPPPDRDERGITDERPQDYGIGRRNHAADPRGDNPQTRPVASARAAWRSDTHTFVRSAVAAKAWLRHAAALPQCVGDERGRRRRPIRSLHVFELSPAFPLSPPRSRYG
jgi:hypothetical protein